MKKLNPIIFLFGFILFACNVNQTPKAVTQSFEEMYPASANILWEVTEDDTYQAGFEYQDHKWTAEFNSDGNWIMSSEELEDDNLPWNIAAYLNVFYPDRVIHCKYIELTERQLYNICFDDNTEIDIVFDKEGIVIKDENNPTYEMFADKYKNATNVDWKKQKNGNFIASFSQDSAEWKATFLADGNWVCSKTEITLNDMPVHVCDYLGKIKNFTPKEFKEKTNAEGKKYMVDGEIRQTCVSFIFDSEGNFLEKVNLDY